MTVYMQLRIHSCPLPRLPPIHLYLYTLVYIYTEKENENKHLPPRNPLKSIHLFEQSCNTSDHAPSCYNLAVMYKKGDKGVG